MTLSPLAYADSLRIENIDFVSPDEIKVLLDIEAPDNVALNTGTPRPFPRINGYVLVPSDEGHLVAQVEWITVERSQYSKRKGMPGKKRRFGALHGRTPSAIAPSPAVRVRWQKETYVFVNGAPAPRGMYRCRGVRRCVFVPVLQLSSQGSVRARICTSSRYSPSIRRFIDGFPCRFFFAPPMPARSVERPQRGISALSLALPGNVNRGYFRSDGLPMQPEKKLAV